MSTYTVVGSANTLDNAGNVTLILSVSNQITIHTFSIADGGLDKATLTQDDLSNINIIYCHFKKQVKKEDNYIFNFLFLL